MLPFEDRRFDLVVTYTGLHWKPAAQRPCKCGESILCTLIAHPGPVLRLRMTVTRAA